MSDKIKILVCDDSRLQRVFIEKSLEKYNIEIMHAENGDEFISYIKQNEYDLCTLDLNMPQKDGLSTLEEIKKLNINAPPIIVITSEINKLTIVKTIELGAKGYLCNPFTKDDLTKQIEANLEGSHKKLSLN